MALLSGPVQSSTNSAYTLPITGQIPLTTIAVAKEQKITYQPLLVAEVQWADGDVLRLATENLSITSGGNQYGGNDYDPRIVAEQLGAISAVSDNGIVQSPQVQLQLADADKFLWNEFELTKGFKGAVLRLIFIFWDPDTDAFSSDSLIKFVGTCDAPTSDYRYLTVVANNKINLGNYYLPTAQICKQCVWTFPVDKAGRIRAARDRDSAEFRCGYSPDVTDGDFTGGTAAARGNGAGDPFTSCNYTWEDCIERMGNSGLATTSRSFDTPVQIEQDISGRATGTFGGIHYDPPDSWRGRAYTSGNTAQGINQANDAKFNDYYPQTWGTSFVEPPVMQVVGDPNSTRFECVLCIGQIHDSYTTPGPVQFVIVNDFAVPHESQASDILLRWRWVNNGSKFGRCNRDAIYDGRGDPYGSMAAIEVVIPVIVAASTSIPSVKVLAQGPMVRKWNSTTPGDYTLEYSGNAGWVLPDVLSNCNLAEADFNLQSMIDGAALSAIQVTYTNLLGQETTHDRYTLGLTIRSRRTAADVLTNMLAAAKATVVPGNDGLLALVFKQTLGDQQPDPVLGSNYNTPVDSVDGTGAGKNGYFAYHFNESNILRQGPERDSPTTLIIRQRSTRDCPNKVNVPFQDEDYSYAADSITIVDPEDTGRTGITVNGGVRAEGVVNVDQAKRIIESQLAEQYRGNPRTGINAANDTGGTWIAHFETNFKAIYLKVGDIIGISFSNYSLDKQAFRIINVEATMNCEKITIDAQWHEDDWYLDSYGQNPAPLLQARHLNSLIRPPFGWLPNEESPLASDPIFDPTDRSFSIAQLYQAAKDGTVLASLQISGKEPPNKFSNKTGPPYAPVATTDGGGHIPAGHYFFQLCAIGSDDLLTAPSLPIAQITVADDASITIPNIYWLPGSTGYKLYGGRNPNRLSLQATDGGTPDSITISDIVVAGEAMPDIQFDHLVVTYKHVWHSGVFGIALIDGDFDSTTISFPGIGFIADEWADRTITIIGQADTQDPLPIWNFLVESNTDDTLTLGAVNGHTPDLLDIGVKAGDVLIMRAAANIHSANTIGDTKFINEVRYFSPPITIFEAAGDPIVLTLATPHNYLSGDEVEVTGALGNSNANGTFIITVPSTPDTTYNNTHITLNSTTSNGTYEGGGKVSMVTDGMRAHEEKGRVVRITSGTGKGQRRKITDNDQTTLTVDTDWEVEPDATSLFIVEDASTLGSFETQSISNSDPTAEMVGTFGVDNYDNQVLLVQAFAADASDRLAVESDSPFREIFVFGGPGTAVVQYDKSTFNIAPTLDLEVEDNVAPIYVVRRAGTPSTCRAIIKTPSSPEDVHIDIRLVKADGSFTGSIFGATKIVLPSGSTDLLIMDETFFADVHFDEDDLLLVDVKQCGTDIAGMKVSIILKWAIS